MAKSAYQLWQEDQVKKQQEKAQGQVRFKEESAKSRLQYSNPSYQGNSTNGNYKWETEMLKDVKMPKGMGKSYNDKFSMLTSQMGMSPGQSQDFRRFMDFGEDQQKAKYQKQVYDFKKDENGNLVEGKPGEGWKLDRTSTNEGPGLNLKNDMIDNILNGMTQRAVQGVQNTDQQNAEKQAKKQEQAVQQQQPNKPKSFNDKYILDPQKWLYEHSLKPVQDLSNRFALNFVDQMGLGQAKDFLLHGGKAIGMDAPEFVQQAAQAPTNGWEKTADVGGQFAGMAAPLGLAYKPAAPIANMITKGISNGGKLDEALRLLGASRGIADPARFINAGVRGGAAMGMYSTAQQGLDEIIHPNDANFKQRATNVGLNMALGATLDPALPAVVAAVKPALSGASNVLGKFAPSKASKASTVKSSNALYDQLINPTPPKVDTPTSEIAGQAPTAPIDELIPFGQTSKPTGRPMGPMDSTPKPELTVKEQLQEQLRYQQWANKVEPRPLPPLERPVDPLNRPQSYWKKRYEAFANDVNKNHDTNRQTKESLGELWTQFAKYDEPVSLEQALDLAYPKNVAAIEKGFSSNPNDLKVYELKKALHEDPKVAEQLNKLNDLGKPSAKKGVPTLDELLGMLKGEKTPVVKSAPNGVRVPKSTQIVNKSQSPQNVLDSLVRGNKSEAISPPPVKRPDAVINDLTGKPKSNVNDVAMIQNTKRRQELSSEADKLLAEQPKGYKKRMKEIDKEYNALTKEFESLDPKKPQPVVDNPAPVTENVPKGKLLMRLDSQLFNADNVKNSLVSDQKPIQSISAIDSIKNPIKRRLNKFYENAVDSTHSAKVAHVQVLENAIKKAEESGLQPKKVASLKEQLNSVKKSGSDFEKSIQNQAAAGIKAKTFLDGHMDELQKALGSTKPEDMADAMRYQVAKNIRWIWDNVNSDYVVGGGWDKGRINTIINSGVGNTKLEGFTTAMKNLTQERLDLALKHNLLPGGKNAHTALSKNPFYIPMARDVTPGMDNVARGLKEGTTKNKGKAGAYFIQTLGNGDAEALYKDPLESLMTGTFSMFKNIAKEDMHKQIYNMAKLDSEKLFTRFVNKKEFDAKGGIAVPTPKGTKYVQLQTDLDKMIQENDLPYDLNVLGKLTSAFAGLKTRSLEYHMTGVPRDLAEGYLKGQINNPVKYLSEIVKAAKEHNLTAKQAGATFDRAYKDGMSGINQEKMMKEYARQNKNVKPFNYKDKESWKELTSMILHIADMPFKPIKAIGQLSDELPRTVEIKATKEAFMKQHGTKIENIQKALDQVNSRLEATSQTKDPFNPALKGVDKLHAQKAKLENMLNSYSKDLEREQTFRGRDIMNFGRSGRSGVAKHIRQYAIFANTTTQSKDKLVRTFIERPVATVGKVALLTAPLVYAEHVMHQNLKGADKDIYDNLPTWAKQYNYVYVNNGNVYTLPKIQELALLTNPIEAILAGSKEDLNATARLAVKETIPYQVGNVAQGLVPNTDGSVAVRKNSQVPSTVFSPALDVAANDKLGFNRNAISFADKFGRQDPKANKFTLDLFTKTFGDKARADYAQYLATQYPGDAGKYGVHILDYLMEPSNSDKLDAMLQNLNPLQDRVYSTNSRYFKNPPKKPAVKN